MARTIDPRKVVVASAVMLGILWSLESVSLGQSNSDSSPPSRVSAGIGDEPRNADLHALLAERCGRCHAVPSPAVAPRPRWPFIFEEMHRHSRLLGQPLGNDEKRILLSYYQENAPEQLRALPLLEREAGIRFRWRFQFDQDPGVTHVGAVNLDRDRQVEVLISDAKRDAISLLDPGQDGWHEEELAAGIKAPARTRVFDWDSDGDMDIVVAGLGNVLPTDDLVGHVTLLVNNGTRGFHPVPLLRDVARVADVAPADLDLDGDIDFVVGMFGWIRSGEIGWLEQLSGKSFRWHNLASIPGVVNVAISDLNRDGRPDFVALVSQAQEEVLTFVNNESNNFAVRTIWGANNPMFGLSGMQLVDLDRDGDDDVLFTNGDVFDARPELRPHNGVHWLENQGALRFDYHRMGHLYGAFSPVTGDLDNDGDLDVVVASFFNDWTDRRRQSLIWLENDGQQEFTMRPLSNSPTDLPTIDLGDFNGDGRVDIIGGSLSAGRPSRFFGPGRRRARLATWVNLAEANDP